MLSRAVRCSRFVWGIVLLSSACAAANAEQRGRPKALSRRVERVAIVVMGEVRHPGVYSHDASQATLGSVLREAGALNANATGSLKIVRSGRMTMQTHAKSGGRMPLQHGDVVIAAGRRDRRGSKGPVEIALLNLLERPVMIHLRSQHADVQSLLRLLRQPAGIASQLRILGPVVRPNNNSGNLFLKSGAIIVFDPRTVERKQLPRLPAEYVVRPNPIRTVQANTTDGHTGPMFKAEPGSSTTNQSPAHASNEPALRAPVPQAPPTSTGGKPVKSFTDEDWNMAPSPPKGQLAGIGTAMGHLQPTPKQRPSVFEEQKPNSADKPAGETLDEETTPAATPSEDESSFSFLTLVVGLFAGLGIITAGGFLWSMGRKAAASDSAVGRVFRKPITLLERLIRKDLEVCEEPFVTSTSLEFFGRTSSTPRSRIDDRHAAAGVAGPHFATRSHEETTIDDTTTAPRADDRHAAPPAPASVQQGALDRALSSVLNKESA